MTIWHHPLTLDALNQQYPDTARTDLILCDGETIIACDKLKREEA